MNRFESSATISYDIGSRKRLEIRSGRGLRELRVDRWLSPIRRHLGTRAALGVHGTDLLLLVAPKIKEDPADLRVAKQLFPTGVVTWFDEVQCSLLKSHFEGRPPVFKFTLKETTQAKLGMSAATVALKPLLVPRRVSCIVTELDQNYLFTLPLGLPHAPEPPQADLRV